MENGWELDGTKLPEIKAERRRVDLLDRNEWKDGI